MLFSPPKHCGGRGSKKTKIKGECFATGYELVFGYLVGEYDLRLVAQDDTERWAQRVER